MIVVDTNVRRSFPIFILSNIKPKTSYIKEETMFKRKTETPVEGLKQVETEMQLENKESTTKSRYVKWGKIGKVGLQVMVPVVTFAAGFAISQFNSGKTITKLNTDVTTLTTTNMSLKENNEQYKYDIENNYILLDSYQDLQEKYTGLQNDYQKLSDTLTTVKAEKKETETKYKKLVQTVQTTESSGSVIFDENDVRKVSGASAKTLNRILKGTWLEGYGEVFYECEKTYKVNALFSIGNAILETGWEGDSYLATQKNNIYGIATKRTFESKSECIEYWFNLISNYYVDDGLISIARINEKYCPPNARWSSDITWIVDKLVSKCGVTLK